MPFHIDWRNGLIFGSLTGFLHATNKKSKIGKTFWYVGSGGLFGAFLGAMFVIL